MLAVAAVSFIVQASVVGHQQPLVPKQRGAPVKAVPDEEELEKIWNAAEEFKMHRQPSVTRQPCPAVNCSCSAWC